MNVEIAKAMRNHRIIEYTAFMFEHPELKSTDLVVQTLQHSITEWDNITEKMRRSNNDYS